MRNFLFTLGAVCMAGSSAFAALSPEDQKNKEIDSIKSHEEFQNFVESEGNYTISKSEDGYVVETDNYSMDVHVKYDENKRIGPAQYELEFETPKAK